MWNNESELDFLEIYETEPILWDPNHKYYKDKKKLHEAWVRISEQTQFSVDELKKKKDSLMATYRGHLRKIKNSSNSGAGSEVYKPVWFAFDLMNSFLGDRYKCKRTINTENENDRASTGTEDDYRVENMMEILIDENIEDVVLHQATTEQETNGPPATRRRKNPPEVIEVNKNMKVAIATLNEIIQKKETPEDDCDRVMNSDESIYLLGILRPIQLKELCRLKNHL